MFVELKDKQLMNNNQIPILLSVIELIIDLLTNLISIIKNRNNNKSIKIRPLKIDPERIQSNSSHNHVNYCPNLAFPLKLETI